MKVLHHVQSLDQADGGLPVAVTGLCSHLSDSLIATADLSANPVSVDPSVQISEIPIRNNALSHFFPRAELDLEPEIELIHQHGLWTNSMRSISDYAFEKEIPLVVSPHGMLEPWAMRHHRLRKRIAWKWFQKQILEQASAFHATSAMEAENIRNLGFTQPIAVLPNGVPDGWVDDREKNPDNRVAIFLSRIHPKKGLPMLIDAWEKVRPEGWHLEIRGDGLPSYVEKIQNKIQQSPASDSIQFRGPTSSVADKWDFIGNADLFILPSFSENFGIVVVEAMEAEIPVITTTATPWKILQQAECGWWVAPETEAIAAALRDATSRPETELNAMGMIGKKLVDEQFRWEIVGPKMEAFYRWIAGEGERPEIVIM